MTSAELHTRIENARRVGEMMTQPGWAIFRDRGQEGIADDKDALVAMLPEKFTSAQGLHQKGLILGEQRMLNVGATIIEEGLQAEAQLEKIDAEAQTRRPLRQGNVGLRGGAAR